MIKNDRWIKKSAFEYNIIDPFEQNQVRNNVISYWVSSFG